MKCPHCGESLGELRCPVCERSLPEDSQYCCWCGQRVSPAVGEAQAELADTELEGNEEGPVDFDSRKLCSDGTCIGVIGADGRCKECGKPYTGEPEED
ncbi:MAG: zinc ribbon domain-containing protein [Deltaproteobacteria bacterium]